MSLERYRRPRLVVLRPSASAYEAARAMADNHVGAILVGEDQKLVGIVTDRDLALDVIAGGLDPRASTVREVMSDELAEVGIGATVDDVVRLMRDHACRRVPIVEDGRPVGLLTLDDLILEGDIDLDTARSIVAEQLEEAARFKPAGVPPPTEPARPGITGGRQRARRRSEARAEETYRRLLKQVELRAQLGSKDRDELALRIVVGSICRRLTPDEARNFISQLPSRLQGELMRDLTGPDREVTTELIQSELGQKLSLGPDRVEQVLAAILDVVAGSVSAGEIEDVRSQLPAAMKDLFPVTPIRLAG
ncbi:MAG: CBS domain-containing protein [Polyangiaceae bacterium]|nr:CBS domain-containing protein [Polyangiaceae bacterium]